MLLPDGIYIDGQTGAMPKANEHYVKMVSELHGLYRDQAAFEAFVAAQPKAIAYEVAGYRQEGADIFFGTTTIYPGKIGDEYFMTRGHYHVRRDCGEAYFTQSGEGLLLLQTEHGETREVEMSPGVCAFIPPTWAHRSVNIGSAPLVFAWFCQTTAGHDYADILTRGMRRIAVEQDGRSTALPNPAFHPAS